MPPHFGSPLLRRLSDYKYQLRIKLNARFQFRPIYALQIHAPASPDVKVEKTISFLSVMANNSPPQYFIEMENKDERQGEEIIRSVI